MVGYQALKQLIFSLLPILIRDLVNGANTYLPKYWSFDVTKVWYLVDNAGHIIVLNVVWVNWKGRGFSLEVGE